MSLQHETVLTSSMQSSEENGTRPNLPKPLTIAAIIAVGALCLTGCGEPDADNYAYSIEFRVDCEDPKATVYVDPDITVDPLQQFGQAEVDCLDAAKTPTSPKNIVILRSFDGINVDQDAPKGKGSSTVVTIAHNIAPDEELPKLSLDTSRRGEIEILGLLFEDIRASELGPIAKVTRE